MYEDRLITITNDWSMSVLAGLFLVALTIAFMLKLKWAYSPSVGEELQEIRALLKEIKEIVMHD